MVDDNSPDGTGQLADEMAAAEPRVHVLHRPGKEGLGRAYIAGFRWALEQEYDCIFEMDADFSHDPQVPARVPAGRSATPIWCSGRATRRASTSSTGRSRRLLLSLGANEYARRDHRTPADRLDRRLQVLSADGCSRPSTLDQVRSNGYSFQIEMSFRAWKKGFRLRGDSDRLHRPGGRPEQDEQANRAGGHLDGLVAPAPVHRRDGCERDDLLQDDRVGQRLRHARRACDRPDGLVAGTDRRRSATAGPGSGPTASCILTPEGPDAVRMTYWNSDGSRAAMCGNAALCSARLAVYLEMVAGRASCRLLTDAGEVRARCPGPGPTGRDQAAGLRRCRSRVPAVEPRAGRALAGVRHRRGSAPRDRRRRHRGAST